MHRWKSKLAGWLLALWLPATMHCALETVPGFSFLQWCCSAERAHQTSSDCPDEVCGEIESGLYLLRDSPPILPSPDLLAVTAWDHTVASPPDASPRVGHVSSIPLKLARSWQFCYRTALPPRAPSGGA
jgi:hypothetical protein